MSFLWGARLKGKKCVKSPKLGSNTYMLQTIKLSKYETNVSDHLMYVNKLYCCGEYLRKKGRHILSVLLLCGHLGYL